MPGPAHVGVKLVPPKFGSDKVFRSLRTWHENSQTHIGSPRLESKVAKSRSAHVLNARPTDADPGDRRGRIAQAREHPYPFVPRRERERAGH